MFRNLRNKQRSTPRQRTLHPSPLLREVADSDTPQTLRLLQATLLGLTEHEAKRRLEQSGYNEIAGTRPPSWPLQLIAAFVNPFVLLLAIVGLVSLVTDVLLAPAGRQDWTRVLILSLMILMSCLLRFWQEFRSKRAIQRLKALVQTTVTVLRRADAATAPVRRDIPLAEVVSGDLVVLAAGDMIPADLRLLSSRDLFVSQSLLTGEALPVEKYDTETLDEERALARSIGRGILEKPYLCFMGSNVISGTGTAVVIATGHQTFLSIIANNILKRRPITNFDLGVNKVSWLLIYLMLVMVPVVFLVNGLAKGDWREALFFALAVAVGLTPEMLPLVVTATLAKGAMKMAQHNVIVKHLSAIQNLGTIDVLCTDKTGTLTEDRAILVRHLDAQGQADEQVLHLAALNSMHQTGLKNPLDQAIIEYTQQVEHIQLKGLVEAHLRYHKLDELPFDFIRRRMSVIVQQESAPPLLICKGAPEEILQICCKVASQSAISPLTEVAQARLDNLGKELHEEGFRLLAVAYKHLPYLSQQYSLADEQDLVFVGFIAFLDAPRASARETIQALATQGVAVKVLTGDNEIVTARICEEVGLDPTRTVLGYEIDGMSDEDLAEIAEQTTVFARVDPLQKVRILGTIKSRGHCIGYIGDGVNDATALHAADVGISVDTAVDIAKESADIILLEKSLLVLEQGIIEGRKVFGNVMKYLKMAISSNFGNALSLLIASAFLPFLPMLPLQLLVQNLLYDLSQLALPYDSVDQEILTQPRRWQESHILRFVLYIGPISSIFDITTFWVLWLVFQANTLATQSLFQSGWFVEGLLSQTLIVHLIRTQKIPFIQRNASPPLLVLTGNVMAVGMLIPFTPLGAGLGLQALPLTYLPWLLVTLLAYYIATQLMKSWYIQRFKGWL